MTTKSEIYALMTERAEFQRADGESQAQAFVKFITKDPEGIKLYECYKKANGPSYPATSPPVEIRKTEPSSAMRKLTSLASELRKAEPRLTEAQAFARVYSDPYPPVRALVAEERRARLAKATAAME
jgi:hypothetical protein